MAGALLSEFARRGYHVVVLTMTEGSSSGYEGGEYNAQLALTGRTESLDACKVYEAQGCLTLMFLEPRTTSNCRAGRGRNPRRKFSNGGAEWGWFATWRL